MSTKTDDRLDEVHRRIGELEDKAHAAGDRAKQSIQSIKGQAEALRQHEAAARAAAREAHEARTRDVAAGAEAAEAKIQQVDDAADARWRESKASVAAARAELDRKADAAMTKIR